MEAAEVIRDIARVGGAFRARLRSLGTEIASMVPGETQSAVKRKVEQRLDVVLRELADGLDKIGEPPDDDHDDAGDAADGD